MFETLANKLKRMTKEREIEFADYDKVTEQAAPEVDVEEEIEEVTPLANEKSSAIRSESENIELKVVRPESFAEVSTIADHLLAGCTVVLNVEMLDRPMTLRMLDFLNGVTYATDGEIKKVTPTTYIVASRNVDVTDAD